MRFRPGTPFLGLIGLLGTLLLAGPAGTRAQDLSSLTPDPENEAAGSTGTPARDSLATNLFHAARGQVPHETAFGWYLGKSYDWASMYFSLASFQALFDYSTLWPHPAPEGLKIRFEGDLGTTVGTEFSGARLVASGDFLAVYEFGNPQTARFVPYVEAGVGLIYTDFQREGQAYRVNFNPVAGIGLRTKSTFITLRAHHLSNGGLNDDNRGINSIVLGFGVYVGSH
jgi:hypothetical protein